MADDKSLTDRMKEAVNSPTVQRVAKAGREFLADPMNVTGAVRAVQERRKKSKSKQGRSSSGRQ